MSIYTVMVGLWVFTTAHALTADVQEAVERFDSSVTILRFLQVTFSLPILFIYLAVSFAAITFTVYSYRVSQSKEGSGFKDLTHGLMLTVVSFVSSGVINIFERTYRNTDAAINLIVIKNYLSLILALSVFYFFYRGSKKVISTLQSSDGLLKKQRIAQITVLFFSAIYTYLVFNNPYRSASSNPDIDPVFAVPDYLIFTTIIIPYVIGWLLGATATVNLAFYAKKVPGIIYRKVFSQLARGFGLIITLTIGLQIIGQFSDFWGQSGLEGILVISGLIILALVIAYLQFGLAARKLDKIETI
jgi:hypothetical protein